MYINDIICKAPEASILFNMLLLYIKVLRDNWFISWGVVNGGLMVGFCYQCILNVILEA